MTSTTYVCLIGILCHENNVDMTSFKIMETYSHERIGGAYIQTDL